MRPGLSHGRRHVPHLLPRARINDQYRSAGMCDSPKSRADHAAHAGRAAQESVGDLSQVRLSQRPRIPEIHHSGWSRVTAGLFPVLRRLDLGVHIGMDLEQVEQVAAGQEFKRLSWRTRTMLCRSRRSPLVSPWPVLSRPQSMPAPFSAFPSQWYRARVLAEAVQEDHCRCPGASTPQALQYTRPVIPPKRSAPVSLRAARPSRRSAGRPACRA